MFIFDYIKDFDDPKLPYLEWKIQMIQAIKDYNSIYGTLHEPSNIISRFYALKPFTNEPTGKHLL
jgi:hypothetical protein